MASPAWNRRRNRARLDNAIRQAMRRPGVTIALPGRPKLMGNVVVTAVTLHPPTPDDPDTDLAFQAEVTSR